MAAVLHEADLAVAAHGEAHVVAVRPGVGHADHLLQHAVDRLVLEAADAAQLVAHDAGLEAQLLAVGDVLELAATAAPEVLAARLDTLIRGLAHLDRRGLDVGRRLRRDFGEDALTGHGVVDEYDAAVGSASDGLAAGGEAGQLDLDRLARAIERAAAPPAPLASALGCGLWRSGV